MEDAFTGRSTLLHGCELPGPEGQATLLNDHRRRLEALDSLRSAAAECGIRADPDRDLVLLPKGALSLFAAAGDGWGRAHWALEEMRMRLPIVPLRAFGFREESEEPLEEPNEQLRHLGGGVEAWAYIDRENSVYKFFMPRIGATEVGATFGFALDEEGALAAESRPGNYRNLLEKFLVIQAVGGMPTEVTGITPEGIVVTKQTLGSRLEEGEETSQMLPAEFREVPSRFLRCDRTHPRILFLDGAAWLVADTHDRNVVRDRTGRARIIDLVAARLPEDRLAQVPLFRQWLAKVRDNPAASLLGDPDDAEW